MKQREWLWHPMQRAGAAVLRWWDGDGYLGPTESSYRPRPTPWLFRDSNDVIALLAVLIVLLWLAQ